MVDSADQISMQTDDLIAEIDLLLEFVANHSIGEYVKIDQMSDVLLDFRQKIANTTSN